MSDEIKTIIQYAVSPLFTIVVGLVVFIYRYEVKNISEKIEKEKVARDKQIDKLENDINIKFTNNGEKIGKIFDLLSEINTKLSTISGEIKTQREICDIRHGNNNTN